MPAIVEFPTVVQEAVAHFADVFANEPEREHLAEYLTGLFVAHKKNVSAINREFAFTTDQSCLNRWLTEANWDVQQLNDKRLAWLQKETSTRYSQQGVIAIDNVLVDHTGKLIEDVGYYWDHADKRYLIAHDDLIANYVCTSGKHYPLEFRRFIKRSQCEERGIPFQNHNEHFRDLVEWVVSQGIPGDFAFDSYFTHAENLNHLHAHERGYVGDLKFNRKIIFRGATIKAEQLAGRIPSEDRKPVKLDGKKQWYFTVSIQIPDMDHKVRIVLLWDKRRDKKARKMLISNRTRWDVTRILKVYRKRWRGTECFHRDGKQHLGMGDCQLRSGLGQTRHQYLVFLAHSILIRQMFQGRARDWTLERLTTIGQACHAVLKQTFRQTLTWAFDHLQLDNWNSERIHTQLGLS